MTRVEELFLATWIIIISSHTDSTITTQTSYRTKLNFFAQDLNDKTLVGEAPSSSQHLLLANDVLLAVK